jgi:hypothetical protein
MTVKHTCQVTRFRRVTPGNQACHPHFPEHPSGHGFHYDDPELVQILEIFAQKVNLGPCTCIKRLSFSCPVLENFI